MFNKAKNTSEYSVFCKSFMSILRDLLLVMMKVNNDDSTVSSMLSGLETRSLGLNTLGTM